MSLADEAVAVTITAGTRTPSRAGFGTPLILGYHTVWTTGARTRRYSSPSAMISAGFTVNDALYKMASRLFGQPNSPTQIVVGRLPSAPDKTVTITITDATEGNVIVINGALPDGTAIDIDYTILAAATTTTVATAVSALLDGLTGIDSVSAGAVITVTPTTSGQLFYFDSATAAGWDYANTTGDAGYDTELSLIQNEDDDWYFVHIDIPSEVNIDDVAAWAESRVKLFLTQTQNSAERDGTGTLGQGLKDAGYKHTHIQYVNDESEYIDCAMAGLVAPKDPGTVNWAWKELAGPTVQALTDSERAALIADNINYYVSTKNLSVTWDGRSSHGQYMDIQRGIDLLTARIQEEVLFKLANTDKVDYTDEEVDAFLALIRGVLLRNSGAGGFLDEDTILVTGPAVADVSAVDKANRFLPDLQFSCVLRGAVNRVAVTGTLSI